MTMRSAKESEYISIHVSKIKQKLWMMEEREIESRIASTQTKKISIDTGEMIALCWNTNKQKNERFDHFA